MKKLNLYELGDLSVFWASLSSSFSSYCLFFVNMFLVTNKIELLLFYPTSVPGQTTG